LRNRYGRFLAGNDLGICGAALSLFVLALLTATRLKLRADFRELVPLQDVRLPGGELVSAAGNSSMFAAMLRSIAHDGPRATEAAFAGVALVVAILFSPRRGAPWPSAPTRPSSATASDIGRFVQCLTAVRPLSRADLRPIRSDLRRCLEGTFRGAELASSGCGSSG
jgi:hypothetical protein